MGNQLITRGFGTLDGANESCCSLMSQGCGPVHLVAEYRNFVRYVARYERSRRLYTSTTQRAASNDEHHHLIVSARLIGVNDNVINETIKGSSSLKIVDSATRIVIKHIIREIKVKISRL